MFILINIFIVPLQSKTKRTMTKVFSLLILCCLIGYIISSCNQYASSVTDNTMADTISVGNTSSVDSATYTFPDRSKCPIKVVVNASYPIDKSLQSIYSTVILELSDTVDISENLNGYANYILMQYCATNNAYSLDDSTDINNESYEPLKSFESRINISKLYDNKGIVTFCKEIIILKNYFLQQ